VRGLSILLVILAHTELHPELHSFLYWPLTLLNKLGFSGVDIFFVLSGFLVGGLLMREYQEKGTIVPSRFFVRRAFKVWPTFYTFLVAYGAVRILLSKTPGSFYERARLFFVQEWPNFLHIQNYIPRRQATLGLFWSLAVEEHFYLVLPWVLILVFGLRGRRSTLPKTGMRMTLTFAGIGILCLVLRWVTFVRLGPDLGKPGLLDGDLPAYLFFFPTHLRIDSLLCGVFLAYVVRFHGEIVERLRPYRHAILLVSLLGWVPFYLDWSMHGYPWGMTVLYLSAAGLVLYAHFGATRTNREAHPLVLVPMQLFAWLGVRSYAIYVWHGYFAKPIGVRFTRWIEVSGDVPGLEGWTYDLIMIGANVLVGAIMYTLVEKPGLRLRQRIAPAIVSTNRDASSSHVTLSRVPTSNLPSV
jgi:peptidoglycan/LPS O-acetylase OafA/YrhL